MISIPENLLSALDAVAEDQFKGRSELIRDAVRLYLAQNAHPPRIEAIARLRAGFKGVSINPEELVREERSR